MLARVEKINQQLQKVADRSIDSHMGNSMVSGDGNCKANRIKFKGKNQPVVTTVATPNQGQQELAVTKVATIN